MKELPRQPNPEMLAWFEEPHSMTQVSRETGWHLENPSCHLKRARQLGLIVEVGRMKDRITTCYHKLYGLTLEGRNYLEAINIGE